jgi:hypothetical protein
VHWLGPFAHEASPGKRSNSQEISL